MNYCPKCRKKLVVQDFCVECGADLSAYQQQENSGIDSFDFSSLGGAAQQLRQQLRDADFEITNGVLTRYRGKDSNVVIPKGVVEIGAQAFSGNNHITSISFPKGVRTIGFHAFSWCKNLTEAVLPSSVRTINDCAFMGCSSLRQLTLPASLTTIGKEAFYDCEQLEKIRFEATGLRPLSESSYPHRIFQNAGSKSCGITVTVAANVHSIPDYLFNSTGCNLTAVVFEPGSICTSIGAFAFCTRDTLRSVQLPHGLTTIGQSAFMGAAISSITIPSTVVKLGRSAFNGCKSLTSVTVPYGVTVLEDQTFCGCKSLVNVSLPNTLTRIGEMAFSSCYSLTEVVIPPNVTSIGSKAFFSCTKLETVKVPDRVASHFYEYWSKPKNFIRY